MSLNEQLTQDAGRPGGYILHVIDLAGGRRASVYWTAERQTQHKNCYIEYKGPNVNRREETGYFKTLGAACDHAVLW